MAQSTADRQPLALSSRRKRPCQRPEPIPITNPEPVETLMERGLKAYRYKKYTDARQFYEQALAEGQNDAAYHLGQLYNNGKGVTKDYTKARELYEQAARHGSKDALFYLGLLYHDGLGVTQDFTRAREYYEQVIQHNHGGAYNNLGYMYSQGQGVHVNHAKAIEYYNLGIKAGNITSLLNLGWQYQYGQGVPKNCAEAQRLYEQAIKQGEVTGFEYLGLMYERGDGVPQDYSKARECYEKCIAQTFETAAYSLLARLHEDGHGGSIDLPKALELLVIGVTKSTYMIVRAKCRDHITRILTTSSYTDILVNVWIKLVQENLELKKENLELKYKPGGVGYEEARKEFYTLAQRADT